jgi:hypothetical protein
MPALVAVQPPSGDPTDEDPLAAVEDDRDPPDPPVRKTARVVRQRVIASEDMEDRGSKPGQRSRVSRVCFGTGAMARKASRFPAVSVFIDGRGNQSGQWRIHSEPPFETRRGWRATAIATFSPRQRALSPG